jgi:tetratricopeptide (TPR) repeat protein
MGCIDEPYLSGTPDIAVFFARWLAGFSFGEAAYASTPVMSWQTTIIGDPLFRPFGKSPRELHNTLEQRHSKLIEWSYLQVIDKGLTLGVSPARLLNYLGATQISQDSAVLTEKLSDLYEMEGEHSMAIDASHRALTLNPTPQQKVRLTLTLAERLAAARKISDAISVYEDFLKNTPDYPDPPGINAKILALKGQPPAESHSTNTSR